MIETRYQLDKSSAAAFDANGVATVVIANNGVSRWVVKLLNVNTSSGTQTRCTVYRGEATSRNQVDFTRSGNGDTSPTDWVVNPGEYLTARWTFGVPGTFATFRVEGDDMVKGRRAY